MLVTNLRRPFKNFYQKVFHFSEKLFGKQPFENHVKLSWFLKMFLENFF